MPRIAGEQDTPVRVRVSADDMSIALEKPKNSSIRNILRAKSRKCIVTTTGELMLRLAVGNHFLWSTYYRLGARMILQLKPGQWVYARVKACH